MKQNKSNTYRNRGSKGRGGQPKKDSGSKRVNYDNTREKKFDEDISKDRIIPPMKTGRSNDIRWYSRNPELLKGSSDMTFYNVTGAQLPFIAPTPSGSTYIPSNSVPAVLSLNWYPYIGGVDNTAINQAASAIYSFVVHANSRNTSYSQTDQMMYILAGGSVFSMIALGIRAYGLMQYYSGDNEYLPRMLLKASGFDPEDLRSNYSHMWFDLNNLIAQSKQIWIPNEMPVLERWFWLNSHVYMDSSTVKGQYYMFVPTSYFSLSETGSAQGTSLNYTDWWNDDSMAAHSWSAYINVVQKMIDDLMRAEDRGLIFGDILKAYGADKLYAVNEIALDYQTVPVYDTEVLTQIENAVSFRAKPTAVTQDANTNVILTTWPFLNGTNQPVVPETPILNFHQKEPPTAEQVMIATRFALASTKSYTNPSSETDVTYVPYAAGTEIVYDFQVWYYGYKNDGTRVNIGQIIRSCHTYSNTYGWMDADVAQCLCCCDWHPFIYVRPTLIVKDNPLLGYKFDSFLGDIDNYTVLDKEALRRMHNTAVYSEFGVPYMK